jgi:CcmD family protein
MIKKTGKAIALCAIMLFNTRLLKAQPVADSAANDLNGIMRSHDKIYVVMAVCITILAILFLYLIRIDIKVSKREKAL